jgi:hypothetical protein
LELVLLGSKGGLMVLAQLLDLKLLSSKNYLVLVKSGLMGRALVLQLDILIGEILALLL